MKKLCAICGNEIRTINSKRWKYCLLCSRSKVEIGLARTILLRGKEGAPRLEDFMRCGKKTKLYDILQVQIKEAKESPSPGETK